jgi:phage-related protein
MATNKIKGLTVEIGGDTTKLGKALENVNKKSRDLSSELGEINRLLKLDPGNAELLAQKQKVLAEAVENTAEKLKILKNAEAQVQEQFQRGEVSEDQVRALQREIMDTERKLGTYEKAAQETADAIDKLGDESEDTSDDAKKVEKAADKAAKELDDFTDSVKKADKASGKLGDTLKSGLQAGLKAVGPAAAKAAVAAGTTLVAATGAAAAGMAKASVESAAYADEMLTMSSVTGIATEDLQAFKYASELVDVDLETLTKSMSKNIKSMKSATDGSKLYVEAYDKLGVSVTDANGNMRDGETVYWEAIDALGKMTNETERDAIAMQLFGKSAQELNPMIEAGSEKMKELTQEAKDVGAVMSEDSLEALGSFDDSIQRLKGSAGAAKNSIGSVLVPELQMMADAGTDLLIDFTQKLNESGGGLDGFVSTIDSMAPEIASKVSDLVSQLLDKIVSLAPSVVNVGTTLVTKLLESISSMAPQLGETAMKLIVDLVGALLSMLPILVETGMGLLIGLINGLTDLGPLLAAVPDIILGIVTALLDNLPTLLSGVLNLVIALVSHVDDIIAALLPIIPQIIIALCETLGELFPVLLTAVLELVVLLFTEVLPKVILEILKAIPQILVAIVSGLAKFYETMFKWYLNLITKIGGWLGEIIKKVATWVSNMASKAREMGSKFITNVINFFKQLPSKIWSWLSNAASKVVSWGSSLVSKGRAAAQKLITAVVDKVKSIPSKMKEAGKNLVQGLWNGINGKYTWIKNKIKGWVGNVTSFIKKLFGIASPSKETAWMGKMLSEGLAVGIEDAENMPLKAMRRLSEGMFDEADNINGVTLERRLDHAFSTPNVSNIETGMLDKLDKILAAIERGQILTIDGKTLIGSTVGGYDAAMGQRRALAARGAL